MVEQIVDIASKLTLTVALVGAIAALVLGVVVSARSVAILMAERDKREAIIVAERDQWKAVAEAAQKQRDAADDRADRLASAFEGAIDLLRGRGAPAFDARPALPAPDGGPPT